MTGTVLAIDVGNSRIKVGVFRCCESSESKLPEAVEIRVIECPGEVKETVESLWERHQPDCGTGIIAGSQPHRVSKVQGGWSSSRIPAPRIVDRITDVTLEVHVDEPDKAGLDRLLNAVAANAVRGASEAVIIVDSGTATTVDYISPEGAFTGGAILPGLALSARALHQYTELLPLVPVVDLRSDPPPKMPGRNTREAIHNGLYYGHVGAIRELCRQLTAACEPSQTVRIMLTGGGAPILASGFPDAERMPWLSLQGLVLSGTDSRFV